MSSRILSWGEAFEVCEYYENNGAKNTRSKFRKLISRKPFLKLMYFLDFGDEQVNNFELSNGEMEFVYRNYNDFKIVLGLSRIIQPVQHE